MACKILFFFTQKSCDDNLVFVLVRFHSPQILSHIFKYTQQCVHLFFPGIFLPFSICTKCYTVSGTAILLFYRRNNSSDVDISIRVLKDANLFLMWFLPAALLKKLFTRPYTNPWTWGSDSYATLIKTEVSKLRGHKAYFITCNIKLVPHIIMSTK